MAALAITRGGIRPVTAWVALIALSLLAPRAAAWGPRDAISIRELSGHQRLVLGERNRLELDRGDQQREPVSLRAPSACTVRVADRTQHGHAASNRNVMVVFFHAKIATPVNIPDTQFVSPIAVLVPIAPASTSPEGQSAMSLSTDAYEEPPPPTSWMYRAA